MNDAAGLREAHDHLLEIPFKILIAAALRGDREEPEGLDAELLLQWRTRAVLLEHGSTVAFW